MSTLIFLCIIVLIPLALILWYIVFVEVVEIIDEIKSDIARKKRIKERELVENKN